MVRVRPRRYTREAPHNGGVREKRWRAWSGLLGVQPAPSSSTRGAPPVEQGLVRPSRHSTIVTGLLSPPLLSLLIRFSPSSHPSTSLTHVEHQPSLSLQLHRRSRCV